MGRTGTERSEGVHTCAVVRNGLRAGRAPRRSARPPRCRGQPARSPGARMVHGEPEALRDQALAVAEILLDQGVDEGDQRQDVPMRRSSSASLPRAISSKMRTWSPTQSGAGITPTQPSRAGDLGGAGGRRQKRCLVLGAPAPQLANCRASSAERPARPVAPSSRARPGASLRCRPRCAAPALLLIGAGQEPPACRRSSA